MAAPEPVVPAPSALAVCREVVGEWQARHCPAAQLEAPLAMAVARIPTWISPLSVAAGVMDIFSVVRPSGQALSNEAVKELGDRLGIRLRDAGLLVAQPRRAGLSSG